jgi:hypothetical protein
MQREALLREEVMTAGDFCRQVVDLAVEIASYVAGIFNRSQADWAAIFHLAAPGFDLVS